MNCLTRCQRLMPPCARSLACALLMLAKAPTAHADAIMITKAATAPTICEFFVETNHLRVELEIGLEDLRAFRYLLPDAIYTKLGYASQFNNDLIWRITAPQLTPQLSIVRGAPPQATVSWTPETGTHSVLQEIPSLAPTHWVNSPSGTNNPAVVSATNAARFYRLTKA